MLGWLRQALEAYVGRIALTVCALVFSIWSARALGPEGRGQFAAVSSFLLIGSQVGSLGLIQANQYHAAQEEEALPALLGNSIALFLLQLGLVGIAALAWTALASSAPTRWLWALALLCLPVQTLLLLLHSLVAGRGRVRFLNAGEALQQMVLLGGLVLFWRLQVLTSVLLVGVRLVAMCGSSLLYLMGLLRSDLKPVTDLALLRRGSMMALRFFVGAALVQVLRGADVLLIGILLGDRSAGIYSVANMPSIVLGLLPQAIAIAIFPRLVGLSAFWQRCRAAAPAVAACALGSALICLIFALIAEPLLLRLFGQQFDSAVSLFLWLLPAAWCGAVQNVISTLYGASRVPLSYLAVVALACAANVATNFALLPRWGVSAAPVASLVAYGSFLLLTLGLVGFHYYRSLNYAEEPDGA